MKKILRSEYLNTEAELPQRGKEAQTNLPLKSKTYEQLKRELEADGYSVRIGKAKRR